MTWYNFCIRTMDIKPKASPMPAASSYSFSSSLKKFFSSKKNIYISAGILIILLAVAGYFIYKKYFAEPKAYVWTEEEKMKVLNELEKTSGRTNALFDHQERYEVLDNINRSSTKKPSAALIERRRLQLLESMNQ